MALRGVSFRFSRYLNVFVVKNLLLIFVKSILKCVTLCVCLIEGEKANPNTAPKVQSLSFVAGTPDRAQNAGTGGSDPSAVHGAAAPTQGGRGRSYAGRRSGPNEPNDRGAA